MNSTPITNGELKIFKRPEITYDSLNEITENADLSFAEGTGFYNCKIRRIYKDK